MVFADVLGIQVPLLPLTMSIIPTTTTTSPHSSLTHPIATVQTVIGAPCSGLASVLMRSKTLTRLVGDMGRWWGSHMSKGLSLDLSFLAGGMIRPSVKQVFSVNRMLKNFVWVIWVHVSIPSYLPSKRFLCMLNIYLSDNVFSVELLKYVTVRTCKYMSVWRRRP